MNRISAISLRLLLISSLAGCASRQKLATELARKGDEIVVAGHYFHTGTPVVLWTDSGGFDAYRTERRFAPFIDADFHATTQQAAEIKKRTGKEASFDGIRQPERLDLRSRVLTDAEIGKTRGGGWDLPTLQRHIDQFVYHYDVAGTSSQCFFTLQDIRGLSVHFMCDVDGTIYQTCDVKERAFHATHSNHRSIGIEIANIGAYPPGDEDHTLQTWYRKEPASGRTRLVLPAFVMKTGIRTPNFVGYPARDEPVQGEVQGKILQQYDLTPQQYDALIKLTATLCSVLPRITCDYPRDDRGKPLNHVLSDNQWEDYSGLMGHYHVQLNKTDPGPAFDWEKVQQGAWALMSPAARAANKQARGEAVHWTRTPWGDPTTRATTQPFGTLVTHTYQRTQDPFQRIYVTSIDLTNPDVKIKVAPGGNDPDGDGPWQTTLMTAGKIADREKFDIVINGEDYQTPHWREVAALVKKKQPILARVIGPAVTDGKKWATTQRSRPCLIVRGNQQLSIETISDPPADATQVIAGNEMLVARAANVAPSPPVTQPLDTDRPSQSAIAIADGGKRLILAVVEGHKPGDAIGLTRREFANLLIENGAEQAMSLSGGDNTAIGLRDPGEAKIDIKNRSGEGPLLANVLGVHVPAPTPPATRPATNATTATTHDVAVQPADQPATEASARIDAPAEHPYPALTYTHEQRDKPPQKIYVATIDLTRPGVEVEVSPAGPDPDGDGKWQTMLMRPTAIAEREGYDVVINGDFFAILSGKDAEGAAALKEFKGGTPARVIGPAESRRRIWSTTQKARPTFMIDAEHRPIFAELTAPAADTIEAISGSPMLVKDGKNVAPATPTFEEIKSAPTTQKANGLKFIRGPHPRTAIGITDGGRKLLLVVVDGRMKGEAAGMSLSEMADVMIKYGAEQAINLDGGGSSVLAIRDPRTGKMEIKNHPSDGRERAVANVLGVRIKK